MTTKPLTPLQLIAAKKASMRSPWRKGPMCEGKHAEYSFGKYILKGRAK